MGFEKSKAFYYFLGGAVLGIIVGNCQGLGLLGQELGFFALMFLSLALAAWPFWLGRPEISIQAEQAKHKSGEGILFFGPDSPLKLPKKKSQVKEVFRSSVLYSGFIAAGLFFGLWRFGLSLDSSRNIGAFIDQEIDFSASIASFIVADARYQKFTLADIELENFWELRSQRGAPINKNQVGGKVLAYAAVYPELNFGDRLKISCKLKEPLIYPDFDYQAFLRRQEIYAICYDPEFSVIGRAEGGAWLRKIGSIQKFLAKKIYAGLKEPAAGILSAMILGEKQSIPDDLESAFARTGLSHIIAISGTHITVMGAMIFWLLIQFGLGRKSNILAGAISLFFYLALIGFQISAIRAYAMLLIVSLAFLSGRLVRSGRVLLLAAFLILVFSPSAAFDIGFQLSFLALWGIFVFYPKIKKYLLIERFPWTKAPAEILAATLAAQIATLPVLAFNFGTISLVAPLANLLTVWLSPFFLAAGWGGLALTLVFPSLSAWWFLPVQISLDYLVWTALKLSAWKYGVWDI